MSVACIGVVISSACSIKTNLHLCFNQALLYTNAFILAHPLLKTYLNLWVEFFPSNAQFKLKEATKGKGTHQFFSRDIFLKKDPNPKGDTTM